MQILYDAQIYLSQTSGGVSRYHYELLKGISQKWDVHVSGLFIKNQYLRANPIGKHYIYDPFAVFSGINKKLIQQAVQQGNYDIFHPANSYDFLHTVPENKKIVFTIHDMIVEKYFNADRKEKLRYAERADKIIAVSETTKKDIIELFNIKEDKIEVIYHGSSLKYDKNKDRMILPDKYILYVGGRKGYKNFNGALKGIAPVLRKNPDLYFVYAGKSKFSKQEEKEIESLKIKNQVLQFTSVDDDMLAVLYTKSLAFIFPSFYEGFGIPILEAWSCGTVAILSNSDCFKEVAGEAALFFDPQDISTITESIEKVLNKQDLKKELIIKGEERLKKFSWDKCVEQTNNLYHSLL